MVFKYLFAIIIAFSVFDISLADDGAVKREEIVAYAVKQYSRLLSNITVGQYISETLPTNSIWPTMAASSGKAGYFPGILWNLYKYTGDSYWRQVATDFIYPLANLTLFTNPENYAVSFGTAYDITGNETYRNAIIKAADRVISHKYNATLGHIVEGSGSQTRMGDTYNLVEVELIIRAWNLTQDQNYYDIAVQVLDNAMTTFVRTNFTTFFNAQFNLTTGNITEYYSSNSPYRSWGWFSRGHMYVIVGLIDVYRLTRIPRFLTAAENLATVYMNNLPDDSITYHEFYQKDLPGYHVRDTTSASIAASYFPEIASYTNNSALRDRLLSTSKSILKSLFSDKYRADGNPAYNLPAFVANATHGFPRVQDYSFCIAEYYFSKAIQYANAGLSPYISHSLLLLILPAIVQFICYKFL